MQRNITAGMEYTENQLTNEIDIDKLSILIRTELANTSQNQFGTITQSTTQIGLATQNEQYNLIIIVFITILILSNAYVDT